MRAHPPLLLCALAFALGVPGCAGIAKLDADGPPLSAEEQATVRGQVDAALAEKSFKAAWAQEVAAGADRARLERIALAALEHNSASAGEMFAALRAKWGDLAPDARARVSSRAAAARHASDWDRALALELLTADDPPAYARAWAVYEAAPHDRAPALLDAIREARQEHAEREESED